jgi:ABC-type nitrate/sulfonate/bicarbonate transport system substrate-binding protein
VAAVLQTNTSALATLKSSGLDRPARLEGKRYAGFGTTFEEPVITTMLKQDGAPTGRFENITTNLFGYQALVAGQADFLWLYLGWDAIQADLDQIELNTFLLKDYGVPDYYTPVIIAGEAFLRDQPDAARRFLAATAQGYEYAAGNAEDAASLLIAGAPPGTFPNPELPRRSAAYLAPFYKGSQPRWGLQTLDYWTNFPRFMAGTGLLKTAGGKVVTPDEIDYAALFTNDFLPQP